MIICEKCGRECKRQGDYTQHARHCQGKKNCLKCDKDITWTRKSTKFCSIACQASFNKKGIHLTDQHKKKLSDYKGREPWNKGKSRTYSYADQVKITCKECEKEFFVLWNQRHRKFCSLKCSISFNTRNGITGGGRGKKCWYESPIAGRIHLQSSWELAYAKYLDTLNINWKRNTNKFAYEFEGKTHNYIPDFYIIDNDTFVEIKGIETEQDRAKWKAFPFRLRILKRKELKEMKII